MPFGSGHYITPMRAFECGIKNYITKPNHGESYFLKTYFKIAVIWLSFFTFNDNFIKKIFLVIVQFQSC